MGNKFNEFMGEQKKISRFFIVITFLAGMFCGATLTVLFLWSALF